MHIKNLFGVMLKCNCLERKRESHLKSFKSAVCTILGISLFELDGCTFQEKTY